MLTQSAKDLTAARKEVDQLKQLLEEARIRRDECQSKLIDEMKEAGFKSVKTEEGSFARVLKKDVKVMDEDALLKDLSKRGLKKELMVTKLDTVRFKSVANSLLKETGEVFSGTQVTESEYISIRNTS